jgi:hypothetical protein
MMSDPNLSYGDLNDELLKQFPNLRTEFANKIGDFPNWAPGPFVVFGSVFNDFIEAAASEAPVVRCQVADFLERLAESSDVAIERLLKIEVLPTLLKSQEVAEAYWPSLGHRTQRLMTFLAPRMAPRLSLPPDR